MLREKENQSRWEIEIERLHVSEVLNGVCKSELWRIYHSCPPR